jgi:hypothetical protein
MGRRIGSGSAAVFGLGGLCGALLLSAIGRSEAGPRDEPEATPREQAPANDGWLTGTADEKFAQIEPHLRGLDVSMAEIGYRYGELLEASSARNWDHARYQAEKIDLSLRLAIERRPKRVESATAFLDEGLPPVVEAIDRRDGDGLDRSLVLLHESCVKCHQDEEVLYFRESVERIRDRVLGAARAPEPAP